MNEMARSRWTRDGYAHGCRDYDLPGTWLAAITRVVCLPALPAPRRPPSSWRGPASVDRPARLCPKRGVTRIRRTGRTGRTRTCPAGCVALGSPLPFGPVARRHAAARGRTRRRMRPCRRAADRSTGPGERSCGRGLHLAPSVSQSVPVRRCGDRCAPATAVLIAAPPQHLRYQMSDRLPPQRGPVKGNDPTCLMSWLHSSSTRRSTPDRL